MPLPRGKDAAVVAANLEVPGITPDDRFATADELLAILEAGAHHVIRNLSELTGLLPEVG